MKKLAFTLVLILLVSLFSSALAAEEVNVYNWEDYIDEQVLEMFEQETGIKVNYINFTTNEDMMVQLRANPGAFDVIFPSDYCVERMIAENLIQPIDMSKITNYAQIDPRLLNADYDPTNEYSVPYMWGTVGILYNSTMVDEEITSWSAMFDEKYAGQVFMMDSYRDTLGAALKYLGYSMNTRVPAELSAARDLLIEQKQKGIVKAYQVDETKDKMVLGEAAMALMWSGDAQYAIDRNPDLKFVVPEEGSNIWVDPMVISSTAQNPDNAHLLIDFLTRPEIAKMNCDYIRYSSPNLGAIELMGAEYTENSVLNPDTAITDRCEYFHDVGDFINVYNTIWGQIKGS
ncbi:MAG: spermidine/putrescine ABC transporter substrate-binding protein [Clostridiales bacterium]|nr:spermidine/putrescine ABC transporter substrate-binding protein [Clostridiales bacterium]